MTKCYAAKLAQSFKKRKKETALRFLENYLFFNVMGPTTSQMRFLGNHKMLSEINTKQSTSKPLEIQ